MKNELHILKCAWQELNTPDDFHDNFYEGLLNQIGHIALGAFASVLLIVIWSQATGEMPHKETFILVCIVCYFINIELIKQKFQGLDSFIDTWFVALGSALLIYPFDELHTEEFGFVLQINHSALYLLCAVIILSLAVYVWPRMERQYGSGGDVG